MSMISEGTRVLIVDDEDGIRYGLENLFTREGYKVFSAGNEETALEILRNENIDAAMFDIKLKESSGMELLEKALDIVPDLVVIMITGYGNIKDSVKAIKQGASDYILKPIDNINLLESLRKNIELKNLRNENRYLKYELRQNLNVKEFLTVNPAVREIVDIVDKVKNTSTSILISGESGTGKEILARYIHFTSNRRDENFIGVNCAALSDSLLLSELFGHEKGAFTGAVSRHQGKFELADKGTLFLDEIGDMSLEIQAKLLRVLEERSFERVGGIKQINTDVRIIAATNRNLTEMMNKGTFRRDLFFRLNVISVHLPPLKDRVDDIPLLVDFFLKKYSSQYGKKINGIHPVLMNKLKAYKWPGNIRELQNLINQAVLLSEGGEITSFHGDLGFTENDSVKIDNIPGNLKEASERVAAAFEARRISETLARNGWNKSKTSRELGITRKTLDKKIEKYGL